MREIIIQDIKTLISANPGMDIISKYGIEGGVTTKNYQTKVNELTNEQLTDFATTLIVRDFLRNKKTDMLWQSMRQTNINNEANHILSHKILEGISQYDSFLQILSDDTRIIQASHSMSSWKDAKTAIMEIAAQPISKTDHFMHYLQKIVNFLKKAGNAILDLCNRQKYFVEHSTTREIKQTLNDLIQSNKPWQKFIKDSESKITTTLDEQNRVK